MMGRKQLQCIMEIFEMFGSEPCGDGMMEGPLEVGGNQEHSK